MKTFFFTLLFVLLVLTSFATQAKKQVVISLIPPGGYVAQTTVYFDYGIIPAYINNQDVPVIFGTNPGQPTIYTLTADSILCSVNGYSPLITSATIALGIKTDTFGTFVFLASAFSNFDSTSVIQIEDRQLHIFTNLRGNRYTVQLTDTGLINGRFFLHVSRAVVLGSVTGGCVSNGGSIQVNADSTVLWALSAVYNSADSLIASRSNVSGPYSFNNLSEGDYSVVFFFNGFYTASIATHVNSNYITATIQPMQLTAFIRQPVTFQTITTNATSYIWNFGDGSQITGIANPTFEYYQAGTFKAVLVCSNDSGCTQSDSVTITVTDATGINSLTNDTRNIWAFSKTITIVLTEPITAASQLNIYNMLGQPVYNAEISNATTIVTLNDKTNGYYIVSLQNNNITTVKHVLLVN